MEQVPENVPALEDIRAAYLRIRNYVHRTPVFTSKAINQIAGADLFFKCENFQKVGAFKFRGATHAVMRLREEEAARGVATHSSGNHAAALALAASLRGIPAYIVMPENSPVIKKKAVAGYGANITFCEPTLQARESSLEEVVAETGARFVHPYNNFEVVCGQGTATLEFLEQVPELEVVMPPVGGGGLLSGTAVAARGLKPEIIIYGAEPAGADDAFRSLQKGEIVPSVSPRTIADGLLTSLGPLTFAVISKKVDDILTCSEDSIVAAMRLIWERMKIVAEPSAAVPLAVVLDHPEVFRNRKVGLIVSGGNVDLTRLPF
ncbi:MAG TPA: pyridoxal-phosphate dependent enzyme [Bacteroidetes bacterium]|nr:pyridoxal-phosphate dependent enzyme [Bacteroidota bacterium]